MKYNQILIRLRQLEILAYASPCPRKKVAAMLIDPVRNTLLADGYNGPPRKGGTLCGGDLCDRDEQKIKSGTRADIGCHHAEWNVICNAAAFGTSTDGSWILTNVIPCLMCSKLIHHAGIIKVITIADSYEGGEKGIEYLEKQQIQVEKVTI